MENEKAQLVNELHFLLGTGKKYLIDLNQKISNLPVKTI